MNGLSILQVIALVLIIEALLPFISPKSYKKYLQQISESPDNKIQQCALIVLLVGAFIWFVSGQ